MSDARTSRELSRLELAVLGLISQGAPCTPYWIRRQFQVSRSSFFSGSAGAVYPAVRRLERRGLVEASIRRNGRRRSLEYGPTADGREVLRAWLLPPLPPEDVAFTMDPVRTRIYSLGLLTPVERRRFVDDALDQARRRVREVQMEAEERRQSGDRFGHLGGLGVLFETRARVRWLEAVKRALAEPPAGATRELKKSGSPAR